MRFCFEACLVVRVSLALLLLLWPACGKRDAELTRCASDGLQLARAVAFSWRAWEGLGHFMVLRERAQAGQDLF